MERVKERLCYVARDALAELAQARLPRETNRVAKEYVLPDGVSILRGYVKGDDPPEGPPARRAAAALGPDGEPLEQLLPLCNERFMVPEALMHPTDIGAPQAGLPEAAAAAVAACSADIRALLWSNVVIVGAWLPRCGMRRVAACLLTRATLPCRACRGHRAAAGAGGQAAAGAAAAGARRRAAGGAHCAGSSAQRMARRSSLCRQRGVRSGGHDARRVLRERHDVARSVRATRHAAAARTDVVNHAHIITASRPVRARVLPPPARPCMRGRLAWRCAPGRRRRPPQTRALPWVGCLPFSGILHPMG